MYTEYLSKNYACFNYILKVQSSCTCTYTDIEKE